MSSRRLVARLAVLCALVLQGSTVAAAELTVSAAASLTNAFTEIGRAFEARNPGSRIDFNFAASGALLQQIAKGAPVDVFASADEETMDDAQARNLVDAGTRIDFVRNRLVVIVPSDAKTVPSSLAGLESAQKIAIGQPASVPVGRYTQSVLEQANLWTSLQPKTIGASSVRQALDYVARGEVDAGFVYATDAAIMSDQVRVAFTVATPQPIRYPIAVLQDAREKDLARRFVGFVASPAAQAVLARYGFAKP